MLGNELVAGPLQVQYVLLATESPLQPLESVLFVFIYIFNTFTMRDYLDIPVMDILLKKSPFPL